MEIYEASIRVPSCNIARVFWRLNPISKHWLDDRRATSSAVGNAQLPSRTVLLIVARRLSRVRPTSSDNC